MFTNHDPGLKAFTVQLIGDFESRSFAFEQIVPGLRTDLTESRSDAGDGSFPDLGPGELRAWLDELPGSVFGPDGNTPGDPLNIVLVGDSREVSSTFARRGWDPTETLTLESARRTIASSLSGSAYRTSPISALTLFGRRQDHALQKIRSNVDERNHLRLWRAPVDCDGQAVWVGQISRDIGVKPSIRTLVTHRIDPEVDEARDYLMQDLISSGSVRAIAYADGVEPSTRDAPRQTTRTTRSSPTACASSSSSRGIRRRSTRSTGSIGNGRRASRADSRQPFDRNGHRDKILNKRDALC